ncbi:MAG: hypothetical protein II684_05215 [Treponema sp.]|nr:hypothetical protein [Alphaproteobacteria bacterium]MBQ3966210.1 hypothetical protein [Treponema sp.]
MKTEDYVSFETAKLLKEKGFGDCATSFLGNGNMFPTCIVKRKEHYPAPTLQMARKWLREDKNVDIEISVYSKGFDGTLTYCADVLAYGNRLIMKQPIINATYEQTCEAAIKYCLENLI